MSRLTYCLQIVEENPPTPQQHCQVEVWPLVVENISNTAKNIIFTEDFLADKSEKVIDFGLFVGHDRDRPRPRDLWGDFFGQLAHVILGRSPFKLT